MYIGKMRGERSMVFHVAHTLIRTQHIMVMNGLLRNWLAGALRIMGVGGLVRVALCFFFHPISAIFMRRYRYLKHLTRLEKDGNE